MKATADQLLNILCTLIVEDRNEIRIIKNKINSLVTSLVISSFAISAFLIKEKLTTTVKLYINIIDVLIIIMMLFAFWRLIIDLGWTRRALEARENLIKNIKEEGVPIELNPFPPMEWINAPAIKDNDMIWVVLFGAILILLKTLAIWVMLP